MYRFFIPALMAAATLVACKPTQRTSPAARKEAEARATAQQQVTDAAQPPAGETPAATVTPAPRTDYSATLMEVHTTVQDYNLLRPWEKREEATRNVMAVYLGEGRLLTVGSAVRAATYVEISLPDNSRTVPGKVLRYDAGLNLALITVANEADASVFDTRTAVLPADPMKPGDTAELWCTARGLESVCIPVSVESGTSGNRMPRLSMKTAHPLPQGGSTGLPVIRDGRLVALTEDYQAQGQQLTCINAELLNRFLAEEAEFTPGTPVLGFRSALTDDPVFRHYLRLNDTQGGLYISEIVPDSAAEAAGLRKGDVLLDIEGAVIDNRGRCAHPLYGMTDAVLITRSIKPAGENLNMTISRNGETLPIAVPLNRDAAEKGLFREDVAGRQPRYAIWGGLVFQPLTSTYLNVLRDAGNGLPPALSELRSNDAVRELRSKGYTELVGLTLVIPTPATQDYENLGMCMVEAVNGTPAHSFAEFLQLLDTPTADGITEISINRAPYRIYLDRQLVETCNDALRRNAVPRLRAE